MFGRSIARAAIVGTAMTQTRTIAELATASSKSEPANSPAPSSANATASTANETRAILVIRIFLLFAKVLKAARAGIVK